MYDKVETLAGKVSVDTLDVSASRSPPAGVIEAGLAIGYLACRLVQLLRQGYVPALCRADHFYGDCGCCPKRQCPLDLYL